MVDGSTAFIQAASEPPPHSDFTDVLNVMLLKKGVIDQTQFDHVGHVQARTALIAATFERANDEKRDLILSELNGKLDDDGYPDLNFAMFGLNPDNALKKLDTIIAQLGFDDMEGSIENAIEAVNKRRGVQLVPSSSPRPYIFQNMKRRKSRQFLMRHWLCNSQCAA